MVPFEEVKTIPPEWKLLPFGEVARSQSCDSNLIKGKQANAPGPGLYPAFSASGQDVWTTKPHHEGDAIIVSAVGARCGKCFRASGQWSAVANTHIIWPDPKKVDADFLWRVINDEDFWVRGQSAQPYVQVSATKHKLVPVPPLPEQQRIAQVLSTVQEAIAQQERLVRTTTELKQALMQKLFTEGLRGEALKETEIGMLPESWEVVKVMDAGTVVTGSTPSTSREDFYGGDYNLISPGDLDVTKYVNTVQKKLTALGFDQCRKLPKGAVLVGCIGNVGKVGIVADDRSATNQQINAIIPNERFDGEFLYYVMDHNRKRLEALAGKVTIPLVNKSNFERFQIAAPPINDQRLIAEALDAVDARKTVADNKRNALQDLFRTLLHELMTGKVRVGEI